MSAEIAGITLRTNLALVCFQANRGEEGDQLLAEVIARLESSADLVGQSLPYRMQAITAYQALGHRRQLANDLAGALAASEKALAQCDAILTDVPALREFPRGAWMQITRHRVVLEHAPRLIWSGRRDEALALVADIDAAPGLTGALAYNVACVLAVLSEHAGAVAREILCQRALQWLRKAASTGFPAHPTEVEHIRQKDTDPTALRRRADFKIGRRDWQEMTREAATVYLPHSRNRSRLR